MKRAERGWKATYKEIAEDAEGMVTDFRGFTLMKQVTRIDLT